MNRLSILIPTWNATRFLPQLVPALRRQTLPPDEILIVDSGSHDDTVAIATSLHCRVMEIPNRQFRHGATRNLLALHARYSRLVYLTQDVLPADPHFLACLLAPLTQGAAAAYARQLPRVGASVQEKFDRMFQYPSVRPSASVTDLRRYYFSNAASAVRRQALFAVGGFPPEAPAGEDRLLSRKLQAAGYRVEYAPEAMVVHSHPLSLSGNFRRYFDFGAAAALAGGERGTAGLGGEGTSYVRALIRYYRTSGQLRRLPLALSHLAAKACGYALGRQHRRLPAAITARLGNSPWCRQPDLHWSVNDPQIEAARLQLAAAGGED